MHGVKKNIKSNDYKYRVNRKLNDNNKHQYISRYVVIADGEIIGHFSSERNANRYADCYVEDCMNQDESYEPDVQIVVEQMELYEM